MEGTCGLPTSPPLPLQNPVFMAAHLAAVAAMVQTSFAHPSVAFHGFFNEGPSNEAAACPGYAASAEVR